LVVEFSSSSSSSSSSFYDEKMDDSSSSSSSSLCDDGGGGGEEKGARRRRSMPAGRKTGGGGGGGGGGGPGLGLGWGKEDNNDGQEYFFLFGAQLAMKPKNRPDRWKSKKDQHNNNIIPKSMECFLFFSLFLSAAFLQQ
jgi:hypothetical protein